MRYLDKVRTDEGFKQRQRAAGERARARKRGEDVPLLTPGKRAAPKAHKRSKAVYEPLPDRLVHLGKRLSETPWPIILPDDWVPPRVREEREIAAARQAVISAGSFVHTVDGAVFSPAPSNTSNSEKTARVTSVFDLAALGGLASLVAPFSRD